MLNSTYIFNIKNKINHNFNIKFIDKIIKADGKKLTQIA
jgi:hypothetical protein